MRKAMLAGVLFFALLGFVAGCSDKKKAEKDDAVTDVEGIVGDSDQIAGDELTGDEVTTDELADIDESSDTASDAADDETSDDGIESDDDALTGDEDELFADQTPDQDVASPEVCDDLMDNDLNGKIDCDDAACSAFPACTALPEGDVCAKARDVNDGDPIGAALAGQTLSYTGDTSAMAAHYATPCHLFDTDLPPDETWRFTLAQPMVVTLTHDFDGDTENSPTALVALYADYCSQTALIDCTMEQPGAATLIAPLPAGTYYAVASGFSAADGDSGPYGISFAFAMPPATETLCTDGLDDDIDGTVDCLDGDCADTVDCPGCETKKELACGESVSDSFNLTSEEHWYSFRLDEAANISATVTYAQGSINQVDVYFRMGSEGTSCDNLYSVAGSVWHTTAPNAAGFAAEADTDYMILLDPTTITVGSGGYTLTFSCGGDPESACGNDTDDDLDQLTDCEDPDCFNDASCTGGVTGENCSTAYPVNDGNAVSLADVGEEGIEFDYYNTTKNKSAGLSAACAAASVAGNDAAYRFVIADTLAVSFGVETSADDFGQQPAVYLFNGDCTEAQLLGCGEALMGMAWMSETLAPGTYHAVVDAGAIGSDGIVDRFDYAFSISFAAPETPEICDNETDDEGDGYLDCDDPECFDAAVCTGGKSGEGCTSALDLASAPLAAGSTYTVRNTTIGHADDLAGSCSSYSANAPDTVYAFTLSASATVAADAQFDNGFTPVLYILPASCESASEAACALADYDTASIAGTVLAAGDYRIVVDGGDHLFGTPMAADFTLTVTVTAP